MTSAFIQQTLHTIGLRPQQAAGQNFLLDEQIPEAMADAAVVEEGDTVLEIGPGLGILTETLLARGARVVAVELDQRLYAYLKKRFRGNERLILLNSDIFAVQLSKYLRDGQYKLVANVPYSSTSLIFRNFLTLAPRPTSITVMIQRDVARRICAQPGDMSMLSLTVQRYCQPEILFDVPQKSFFPAPAVMSSVVYCGNMEKIDEIGDKQLFWVMKAGFSSRRKKLSNSLASVLRMDDATLLPILAKVGIKETARAQELSLADWQKLANEIS